MYGDSETHAIDAIQDSWEDVHMICPNQCVCMHSPFMDLSIARWIQDVKRKGTKESTPINENEVIIISAYPLNECDQI